MVDGLTLRTVVDLRTDNERTRDGMVDFGADSAVHVAHRSLNPSITVRETAPPDWGDLGAVYLWMAEHVGTVVVEVLRLLVEPNALPGVFHCAGGKDRTGIVAGLILAQLGVPDEFVTAG